MTLQDSPKAFVPKFASFVHLKVAHGDGSSSCPKVHSPLHSLSSDLLLRTPKLVGLSLNRFSLQDTSKSSMFFGSQKTPISIEEYIKRIALHSKCSPICFIGAYVYLQRLSQVSLFTPLFEQPFFLFSNNWLPQSARKAVQTYSQSGVTRVYCNMLYSSFTIAISGLT